MILTKTTGRQFYIVKKDSKASQLYLEDKTEAIPNNYEVIDTVIRVNKGSFDVVGFNNPAKYRFKSIKSKNLYYVWSNCTALLDY